MSNFPTQLDDDASIIRVDDNLTEVGGLAINQLRSAVFAIERELGTGGAGSSGSVAARLGVSVNANGTLKPSAIAAAGAIVGPITNTEVSATAAISESKLALTYSTQTLYNEILALQSDVNGILDTVTDLNLDFIKHLTGKSALSGVTSGRHVVSHIDINSEPSDSRDSDYSWPGGEAPRNVSGALRGSNLAAFLHDLNDDLVRHQKADGTVRADADQYAHPAAGISVDSDDFVLVPKTVHDLQAFANFVDSASFSATANHQQNHHTNGVSRTCRGSILNADGYGPALIPYTAVNTYLANGGASAPTDNNVNGDDIIEFVPTADATFYFDSLFSQVRAGDVITVNYGSVEVQHVIESVRYTYDGGSPPNRAYLVRINGRNLQDSTTAVARIDRPKYTDSKFGVLALSAVNNNFGAIPSLLVGNPRAAAALGLGFNASKLNSKHYNLYLELYPTGNPFDKAIVLPAIDVTGNAGATPGKYTLESVVEATNNAFHKEGYNFRFSAFAHNGEFGIMLSDAYNNASFSIISGVLDTSGALTTDIYTNNVVGDASAGAIDPLGFGSANAAVASPAFRTSYANINQAQVPTKVFVPLDHKNYYVNGNERDALQTISDGYSDNYSDTYWLATILSKTVVPTQTVRVTYEIPLDLRASNLRPGKTIVVQPQLSPSELKYNDVDYGRFIISDVSYNICDGECDKTYVEVYNGVHATGTAISTTNTNIPVRIYFGDDSVSFAPLNLINPASSDKFKRLFEVYVDENEHTFTHERARFNMSTGSSQIVKANIAAVSPKLRGYLSGGIYSINLRVSSYDTTTGVFTAYLGKSSSLNVGPTATGKKGQVTRLYDETQIDYIDIVFDANDTISTFSNADLSIDLFPSLRLDQEVFYLGSVLYNEITNKIGFITNEREFGNVSEAEFSTSALNFVNAHARFTQQNGVVRGLDYLSQSSTTNELILTFRGGLALINGKYVEVNNFTTTVPIIKDNAGGNVLWATCINANGEIQLIPLRDYANSIDRVFEALNPANSQTYYLESATFNELATQRKDLTPIALVQMSVTDATTFSGTVSDARKMIRDSSAATDLVWTSDTQSGHFASFESLNNWLKYNATFNNTVRVRGSFSITSSHSFDYTHPVKFVGDGATITLTGSSLFTLTQNVTFEGIKFVYVCTTDGSYSSTNLVNSTSGALYATTGSNIKITNCEFTTGSAARHPFITFNLSGSTSAVASNIEISKNRFNFPGSTDDKRAVIAFAGPSAAPTSTEQAYLINVVIDSNICDKNQMISISSAYNSGTSTIRNALSTVGCRITNNVCGAINFLTRQNTPSNTVSADLARDKDNLLRISGNTCRLIYSGGADGQFLYGSGGNRAPLLLATGIFSGSALIDSNTVTWIHTALRVPSSTTVATPTVMIKHNKMNAYIPSFLSDYYYGFTANNTAIIADSTSGS